VLCPKSLRDLTAFIVNTSRGIIVRYVWSPLVIAAILSIPIASAQPVPAQAPAQQGGPAVSSLDSTLRFEVVSVKLSAPSANTMVRQIRSMDPGRLRYTNVSLKDLVLDAYNLKAYQVIAPDWLGEIAVDIDAIMRPGTTKEQVRVMFQNMLADRFKLAFHWDSRELPAYSIAIASTGPKMKESIEVLPSGSTSGNGVPPSGLDGPKLDADGFPIFSGPQRDGAATVMINGRSRLRGQRATIQDLANELSRQLKYPVTDQTALKAKYDFTLKFATPGWSGELEDIPELGIWAAPIRRWNHCPTSPRHFNRSSGSNSSRRKRL
jgi:uncharacterized protein (TIGR03435 family)